MDQVKSNFFENQILEAIETVANGIVSKLQFDQTILCTITNDNKRKNGEYEVSNGSSTFKAFSSDTNYKKDMAVYVLVPQGDFERQKTIVGKYVDDTATAINYIPASQSIIEVAKIEIPQDEFSLLANGENKLINIIDSDWNNTNIYDCVSLKANFKTDLSKYNIIDGDYGLMLTLKGYQVKSETKEDGTLDQTIIEMAPKFYKFSCNDMFGDPYNYNIYFDQDIVFDLSKDFADIKINHYRLDFYQNGKFSDLNGEDIPYRDIINNVDFNNNLFVKDIQMSFGYSTVDIKEEGIQIYTPDNLKYIDRLPKKNIVLKWFQKNEVGNNTAYGIIDTLDEAKENNYSVYWYRYRIGASEDELAGAFWELLDAGAYNDNISYDYELVEDPNGKYAYKGSKLILADSDNAEEKRYRMKIKTTPGTGRYENEISTSDPYNISFAPDKLLNREKIKAILVKYEFEEIQENDENDSNIVYITFKLSPKIYESNEIIFENENPASLSLAAVDLIRNMRLECQDGSNGIYKLYNGVDNVIIGNEDTRDRTLNVIFDTYSTIDIPSDEEKCSIKWKIPKDNSMIHTVNFSINNTDEISIPNDQQKNIVWQTEGNYYTCSYNWVSNIAGTDNHYEGISLPVHYRIHDYYTQSYSNNTIICEITKYNRVYTTEIEFIFGETGTNGTGYTLNLRLEKEYDLDGNSLTETPVPCLTADKNKKVKVIATLFDEHGNDITDKKTISWNWRKNNSSGFSLLKDGNNSCYVKYTGDVDISQCYGILQAMVSSIWNGNTIQLTGYLPIGIRAAADSMLFYNGTTKVIYDAQGSKPVFQAEHSLNTEITSWQVKVLDDSSWERYAPYFKRETGEIGPWNLAVRDIYFTDLSTKKIVIQAFKGTSIIYSQSLLYDQNRFGNAMFNDWDGSLTIDKDGNKILSALIGAGKKETDNTFTGVVMGKTTTNSGLIGYSKGVQTFGFDTDGTAFIGASGTGQIRFDGTHGTIKSAIGNTELDLKNGKIYLSNENYLDSKGEVPVGKIIIDSDGIPAYFQISHYQPPVYEDDGKTIKEAGQESKLIHIGTSQYYLQSFNYTNGSSSNKTMSDGSILSVYTPGTGMKIDLKSGVIQGYDFKLVAGQKTDANDYRLIITSDQNKKPLTIGSNFYVDWDGSLHANNGKFIGLIEANTGKIGGWTIVPNALYYGNKDGHQFNKTTNYLTSFKTGANRAFFAPGGVATTNFKYSTTTYEITTDATTGKHSITQTDKYDNTLTSSIKILFNVGQNFAITTDGTIYANALYLKDYAKTTDLKTLSDEAFAGINKNISSIGSINNEIDDMNKQYGSIIKVSGNNKTNTYMTKGGSYDGVTSGYFFEGNFYSDAEHKTLMNKKNNYVYVDISTGDTYSCKNSTYTKNNDIKFFTVSTKGLLTANNAVISGTIYATNGWFSGGISASEGHFGNWKILKTGQLKGTPSKNGAGYEIILNPNYEAGETTRTFYYIYTQEVKNSSPDTVEDDTDITGSTINSTKISFDIKASDDLDEIENNFVKAIRKQTSDRHFQWGDLPLLQRIVLMTQFIFFHSTLIDTNIFKIKNTNTNMIFGIDGNGFLNWRFYENNSFSSEKNRFIIQTDGNGLNIGWVDWNQDMARATWSFTSDGNLSLSKLKSTSYKDNIGGFQLYGEDASDKFWNNSFFTTNTIKTGSNKYSHYVSFLRAVGSTSNSLVNVFIGCKQYDNEYENWPSNDKWSSKKAQYIFYIRFDGRVKFETFHTYKWTDDEKKTNYTIRPNEPSVASDGTSRTCKYYLGTAVYPWTGLHVEFINGENVSGGTLKNTNSDIRLKNIQSNDILEKALKVYNNLTPIAYKYKNFQETNIHKRTHIGFIAQDVEQQIFNQGLTNEDFAIVKIYQAEGKEIIPGCEDGKKYQLDYNELHGLHVLKNQEQDKRILELEQKVQYLENKILELSEKGV